MELQVEKKFQFPLIYCLICNIPPDYHTSHLRKYFSQFIENGGFECFHFRHRPEGNQDNIPKNKKRTCCVVRLENEKGQQLINMYNNKHWLDGNGDSISQLCKVSKLNINLFSDDSKAKEKQKINYQTRSEKKLIPTERETFTPDDLENLQELHPPSIMKNGNVGTPTLVFLKLIQECRLPSSLITKLGLVFPKQRTNKRYGTVHFDYGQDVDEQFETDEDSVVVSAHGTELESDLTVRDKEPEEKFIHTRGLSKREIKRLEHKKKRELMDENIEEKMINKEDSDLDNDDDTCEEWERHEALTDDPTNQERNSERLFEEEIELKWEKGGSGLVFYTDAQFWKEQEGDFDEQTADDWDIDMSAYYEKGAGDKDILDLIEIQKEKRRKAGLYNADDDIFKQKTEVGKPGQKINFSSSNSNIGKFEQHTKGIGRKVMQMQGWKEGDGLGSAVQGIKGAIESEWKHPKDKKGIGYHGEKMSGFITKRPKKEERLITTIYDDPKDTDPQLSEYRRNDHYRLSHRDSHLKQFVKGNENDIS